jgi:hypothetical protein
MTELKETLDETLEHAQEAPLNARIALIVAFTATFMALCNVKGGNISQAMAHTQAESIDAWAFFQAKSTKQTIAENTLEILRVQKGVSQDLIHKYEEKVERYEKEKTELKTKAESLQAEYERLNVFDDLFDVTEALLSIAIALFGVTALTQKRWLFSFASSVSVVGLIFGMSAFLKIKLNTGFLATLLG